MRNTYPRTKSHQEYILLRSTPEPNTGCWLWSAPINHQGYGKINESSIFGQHQQAHRASYKVFVGEIPEGLELDHECNVRICVNPDHLKPVTRQVNAKMRQRDHKRCKHGHEFTPENTYWDKRGWRQCKTCRAATSRRAKLRKLGDPTAALQRPGRRMNLRTRPVF